MHILMDPANPIMRNAGAGAFCQFFQLEIPVVVFCENFDRQISAVLLVTETLKSHLQEKIVSFIDSQAEIRALVKRKPFLLFQRSSL
ncbi:hypothetical protein CEXT_299431 [Caerostris extrusa]|uniref:Uncharacterized protein n=1 Tax=Caerostris extrusa TaxID=172846 RepID=A0AAV4SRA0_CAEEX|nr:hypothetical protein CEXT_299431 [Caerostris extrusa]